MDATILFHIVIISCVFLILYLVVKGLAKESLVLVFLIGVMSLSYCSNLAKQKVESDVVELLKNLSVYQKEIEQDYWDNGTFFHKSLILEDGKYLISKQNNLIKVVSNEQNALRKLVFSFPGEYILIFNPDDKKWKCFKELGLSNKIMIENNIPPEYIKNCAKEIVIVKTIAKK